ncbi:MAG TPA: hypothetical protein VNB06_01620 [Thermoanaerobaculia bacterium]|nr:hypothetical protein [Thermoanaerobaculia bacterium]
MFHLKVWMWSLGIASMASFVLCVVWGLVTTEALHMHEFLEQVLPGFTWLTPASFVLGFIESFLWGAYAAIVFVPLHNFFHRRWATPRATPPARES